MDDPTKTKEYAKILALRLRLQNYPGAHANEAWKLEKNLHKCTEREKLEMARYGVTVDQLMREGFNRGEVHHMLFGYKHEGRVGR